MLLALAGKDWAEDRLEPVAAGRCGANMAADLERLRSLRSLEKEISKFDHLCNKTEGLWDGQKTRIEELEKALEFQETLSYAIAQIATTAATTYRSR